MIVPNSYEIYDDKLPTGISMINQEEIINDIYDYLKYSNDININSTLSKNKDSYIYYKTDHHWTTYGAYLAYEDFIRSVGLEKISLYDLEKIKIDEFYGSYFSKAKPFNIESDTLTYYKIPNISMNIIGDRTYESLYDETKVNLRDKYSLFLRGNNPLTIIKNMSINNGKKILVIKDSFANSLIPFLTQNYEEVQVIDLRIFSIKLSEYIEKNNFDDIFILYNFINLSTDNNIIKIKY